MQICVETKLRTSPRAVDVALEETMENLPTIETQHSLGTSGDQVHDALALLTGKKWQTGRTITVWFDKMPAEGLWDKVWSYFLEWTEYANINFKLVLDRTKADCRVGFVQGIGSWSYNGTDNLLIPADEHTMNFGWLDASSSEAEIRRVVLHEVGHLLGAIHEHQSPGAGGPELDKPVVVSFYQGPPNNWTLDEIEHNVFRKYAESSTNFTAFDRGSIMAYPLPNEFTIGDYFIPLNTQLSAQDKEWIAWSYPGRVVEPPAEPLYRRKGWFNVDTSWKTESSGRPRVWLEVQEDGETMKVRNW
jgi:hypothetical protein